MWKRLGILLAVGTMLMPVAVADHVSDGAYGGSSPAYAVGEETVLRALPSHVLLGPSPDGLAHIQARARISHDDAGLQPGVYLCVYSSSDGSGTPIQCRSGCFETPWISVGFVSARAWVYVMSADVQAAQPTLSVCQGASSGLALIESITDPWA